MCVLFNVRFSAGMLKKVHACSSHIKQYTHRASRTSLDLYLSVPVSPARTGEARECEPIHTKPLRRPTDVCVPCLSSSTLTSCERCRRMRHSQRWTTRCPSTPRTRLSSGVTAGLQGSTLVLQPGHKGVMTVRGRGQSVHPVHHPVHCSSHTCQRAGRRLDESWIWRRRRRRGGGG